MSEDTFQADANNFLTDLKVPFLHIPKGRGNAQRFMNLRGWPDLMIWYRQVHADTELKTPTGTLTDSQKIMFPLLADQGFEIPLQRNMDEFVEWFEKTFT